MPIRPENKALYPSNWPEISDQIRRRAGHRCEKCGVPNYELGGRLTDGTWCKAEAKGEKLLRLEWPSPGEHWFCRTPTAGNLLAGRHKLRIVRIVLTVAHLDHNPANCDPANLKCWCQYDHLRYDAKHKAARLKERRRIACAVGDLLEGGK